MRAVGAWSIASFIRVILDVAWWVVAAGLVVLIGVMLFSLSVKPAGGNLTMDLPVAVELAAPVSTSGGSPQSGARIENLQGNLRFPVRDGAFFSASVFLVILAFGVVLWVLTQLRHIFRSLSRGVLFAPDNARRMRWVGCSVIFGELARAALVYFWSYYTSLHFTADGARFVAMTDFNVVTIIAGLAILVVAEVFREASRLHQEQSLTI